MCTGVYAYAYRYVYGFTSSSTGSGALANLTRGRCATKSNIAAAPAFYTHPNANVFLCLLQFLLLRL